LRTHSEALEQDKMQGQEAALQAEERRGDTADDDQSLLSWMLEDRGSADILSLKGRDEKRQQVHNQSHLTRSTLPAILRFT
jgi:hypothetical protein